MVSGLGIAASRLLACLTLGPLDVQNKFQVAMWLALPVWIGVVSVSFVFRSGLRAWAWLGGANLAGFALFALARNFLLNNPMRSDVIRVYKTVHTWTGIVAGLALFIAFYAGAITMFKNTLDDWVTLPSPASEPAQTFPLEQAPAVIEQTLAAHLAVRR